jgi:Protein of unknown function (DUF3356).
MRGVELTWAGGEHEFKLTIDLLRALQEKCDAGPAFILQRLATQRWHVDDVFSTIRLGLEGGGMSKEDARKLVNKVLDERPIAELVMTAQAILMAALYGVEDDPVGESPAGGENGKRENPSREESGASPASTNGPMHSTATSEP